MPARPNSTMRKKRAFYYGWVQDGIYYLSLQPREANEPANQYETAAGALKDASQRMLPIQWEDPSVV
jgi:hypothetical protein